MHADTRVCVCVGGGEGGGHLFLGFCLVLALCQQEFHEGVREEALAPAGWPTTPQLCQQLGTMTCCRRLVPRTLGQRVHQGETIARCI